ncbi:NlpC/P60 family protein [Sphingopyxis sp. L1A2A]|uniref:NlpC/P60 family protein n=1 Tax=Sphingopyxis sp. L1A2A TaxID=2502247 RepID=UPI002016A190|nr:NlpC/P60 family protein [Sphingopyxis sp. L1A2A]
MADDAARAFAAAQAMVGVRFRPQGRDPATGLDCVGLVWAAYAAAGARLPGPTNYPLRGWSRARVEAGLAAAGFAPVQDAAQVGDVALIACAAGQFHLGLIGAATFVHAHAGLRRVVETPVDALAHDAVRWRFFKTGDDDGNVGADGGRWDCRGAGRRGDRRGLGATD